MRKLTKKISMLMVLAMLVGLFSGVVSASAASKWAFKSDDLDVAVGATINLKKNQYEDFDLYKNGVLADADTYTITWESSDADVVWVNAKSGQLRADKFKKAEDGAEAVITANIVNNTNKATHKVSFTIVVGEVKLPAYTVNGGEDVTIKLGEEVKFAPVVTDEAGEVVKFATHKSYNGYFVDGKAIANPWTPEEAGEYTVVVAQFASKAAAADLANAVRQDEVKVVVKPAKAAIVSYKQTALNAVEITLNDASFAEQILADNTLLKTYMVSGGNNITVYTKSIAGKKDVADTLVVTMFNNFSKDVTYKFAVDESVVSFNGAESKPVRVEVVSKAIVAKTEGQKMQYKVYNELGTDITADITPLNGYTWKYNVPETNCFFNGVDELYFFESGKEVTVEFVLDLGYDKEGNKLGELKASGVYYSVAASTASNPEKYAIEVNAGVSQWTAWGTSLPTMADGDDNYFLVAQYTKKHANGYTESKHIAKGRNENGTGEALFTYKSSNEAVMLIDAATGELTPVAAGSAVLFILDADKNTVGAVTVNVVGGRNLASFTVAQEASMLSVGTSAVDFDFVDGIKFTPTAKDQLGAGFAPFIDYKIAYPLNLEFNDYFAVAAVPGGNGKQELTAKAALATLVEATKTQAFQIEVNAYQNKGQWNEIKKSAVLKFSVKNISTVNAATNALTLSTNNVDTKLNQDALWKYNADVTLVAKDRDAYKLGVTNFTVITGASMASTVTGAYSVLVLKNNAYAGGDCGLTANAVIDTITFETVKDRNSDGKLDKLNGQYVIKLYKGDGTKAEPVTQQTLNITDSTSKIKAVVESDKLPTAWTAANVNDVIKFVRDGSCLDDNGNVVSVSVPTDKYEVVGNKLYIKAVKVVVNAGEMNYGALGAYTFEEEVAVNTLFTLE